MPGTPSSVRDKVVAYFRATTEDSYLANWSGDSLGFHFGLGDESTQSLSDSIRNTNEYLADKARIQAGTRVLDAGCGVGGSSIWLAKERGARVTGITIVDRQVELARAFALERGVAQLADFEERDMLSTGFPGASFDVVWCVESVCHVVDLDELARHAAFLLRDGGHFASIDLCGGEESNVERERVVCEGWAMAALRPPADIVAALGRAGFEQIVSEDLTERAAMSARALESMAGRSLIKLKAERAFLGKHDPTYEGHVRAALAMTEGLRTRQASIVSFVARRPARSR
jgi:cyclopropane fatty-acyl-phospholipid synthase-like methyltransferase